MKAAINAFSIFLLANQLAQPGYACESDADCSCVNGLCIDTDQVVCGMISDLVCDAGVNYPPCHCDMSTEHCRKTCPPDEHNNTSNAPTDDNDRQLDRPSARPTFDSPITSPTLPPQATLPPFGEGNPLPTRPTPPPQATLPPFGEGNPRSTRPSSAQPTTTPEPTSLSPTFSPSMSPTLIPSISPTLSSSGSSSWGESSPHSSSAQPTTPAPITAIPATGSSSYKPTIGSSFSTVEPKSLLPTSFPYGEPCEATADADVCIAVDSSGSSVNFHDVQVIASTLVARLNEKMTGSINFSLVQFADESYIHSELTSANTAIVKVSDLPYTGGMKNTEGALTSCQSTLASSKKNKYIVLVTDGVPTTSNKKGEPFSAALAAADEVKTDNIFIIEAVVEPIINDDSGKEVMKEICSGEHPYNVADFDDLDTIVDAVAEPVLCAMDNSMFTAPPKNDGCPDQWMEIPYEAGDVASADGLVFQCKPEPLHQLCGQYGYNPSNTESLKWKRAWTLIGYCDSGEESPQPSSTQPTIHESGTAGTGATAGATTFHKSGEHGTTGATTFHKSGTAGTHGTTGATTSFHKSGTAGTAPTVGASKSGTAGTGATVGGWSHKSGTAGTSATIGHWSHDDDDETAGTAPTVGNWFHKSGTAGTSATVGHWSHDDDDGTAGTAPTVGNWFHKSGTAGTSATVGHWSHDDDDGTAGTAPTVGNWFDRTTTLATAGSPCVATADADVCIAVESSGSVLKFHDVQIFASSLVERLEEQMAGSINFSLVQFADESSIQSELTTAKTAMKIVSDLTYTSGMTNTEAALISCQATLTNSSLKKYIVLLTDGVPTTSDKKGEPYSAAMAAADKVKTDNIFVIEAFVEPINDDSGKEVMMDICSGESLYNVADFDDFDTIVDAVAEPILC